MSNCFRPIFYTFTKIHDYVVVVRSLVELIQLLRLLGLGLEINITNIKYICHLLLSIAVL